MVDGNSIRINNLRFYSVIEGPAPLIARSLLVYGEKNNIDIKKALENFVQDFSTNRQEEDENSDELNCVKWVLSIIEKSSGGDETAYEKLVKTGRAGAYHSGADTITMEILSSEIAENLPEPPELLIPLLSETNISAEAQSFRSTLSHEFTHAWLNRKVDNYSQDEIPSTLNEIFAYFVSYTFKGYLYSKEESDLYERPDLIKWGVKLLKDKFSHLKERGLETNEVDFTRKMQAKVYGGSVKSFSPHFQDYNQQFTTADFKPFLRFCLFKEDKERLEKLRGIGENLESTFGGLEHLLFGDAKAKIEDPELEKELERLREKVDWDNPEKIERRILEDIMDRAVGQNGSYGTLYWVNSHITAELENEHEILKSYIKAFEKVREDLDNREFEERIKEGEQQLIEIERELEKLLDDKYSVKT